VNFNSLLGDSVILPPSNIENIYKEPTVLAEYGITFGSIAFAHNNRVSTCDLSGRGCSLTALHNLGKTQMLHQTTGLSATPAVQKPDHTDHMNHMNMNHISNKPNHP
jgi:hypothetical protein